MTDSFCKLEKLNVTFVVVLKHSFIFHLKKNYFLYEIIEKKIRPKSPAAKNCSV